MMSCLTPFHGMQPATDDEAAKTAEAIRDLRTPTPPRWLNARIATLLAHFYVANTDPKLMEAIADDWHHALKGYPAWAIAKACRFWLSMENPRHKNKPTPGEIQELADKEFALVRVAEYWLKRGVPSQEPPKLPRYEPTLEERRAIAALTMAQVYGAEQ